MHGEGLVIPVDSGQESVSVLPQVWRQSGLEAGPMSAVRQAAPNEEGRVQGCRAPGVVRWRDPLWARGAAGKRRDT